MDFLRRCASDLDDGVPAQEVLARMWEKFSTVQCMSAKTSLVRSMCRPSEDHTEALEALCREHPAHAEALRAGRRADADVRELLRTLPARLPQNARMCRITRAQMIECKRHAAAGAVEKNRRKRRVQGRALLGLARDALRRAEDCRLADLALALMLLTGRRTCEILNGTSAIEPVGAYAVRFVGLAKQRSAPDAPMRIPTLAAADAIAAAFRVLRGKQRDASRDNRATSATYQSLLSRALHAHPTWKACGRVHALRGVYACMCTRLFEWEDASDAYVTMRILGHRGLGESLVYTPYDLGRDFGEEPHLGAGTFESEGGGGCVTSAASVSRMCPDCTSSSSSSK